MPLKQRTKESGVWVAYGFADLLHCSMIAFQEALLRIG